MPWQNRGERSLLNPRKLLGGLAAGVAALGVAAVIGASGAAAQAKEAKDVHIIFVTHGQANDVYWSVVKNGVEAGQKAMGSQVEYHAPETFDMVQMARLIDAAIASKPDAIVVSIPDADSARGIRSRTPRPPASRSASSTPAIEQVHDWGLDLWVGGGSEYDNGVRAGEIMGEAGVKHARLRQPGGRQRQPRRPLPRPSRTGLAKSGGAQRGRRGLDGPDRDSGRVEAYLTAHPDIDGVLALGPAAAEPIMQAARGARPARQDQDGHVRPFAGGAGGDRQGRHAVRHRQPAIPAWATCRSSSSP